MRCYQRIIHSVGISCYKKKIITSPIKKFRAETKSPLAYRNNLLDTLLVVRVWKLLFDKGQHQKREEGETKETIDGKHQRMDRIKRGRAAGKGTPQG